MTKFQEMMETSKPEVLAKLVELSDAVDSATYDMADDEVDMFACKVAACMLLQKSQGKDIEELDKRDIQREAHKLYTQRKNRES